MKQRNFLTRLLAQLLVVAFVLTASLPVAALNSTQNVSTWNISNDTEIFWEKNDDSDKNYAELKQQVQLFSAELAEKVTTNVLPISYGDITKAGENDIILTLDSSSDIAEQGYNVQVVGGQVKVSAADTDGLFYGCRNIIKQLLTNGTVSDADEAPDVLERGLSLDNGRKYYSVEWIKEMIRELSWADMNTLVLHFSEEMGWGIESKLYPWLAGRDGKLCTQAEVTTDNRYLTQDEVKEIVNYAKLYHVDIIPSIDSPGHLNYMVMKFNEQCETKDYSFTYNGKTYTAKAGSEIGNYYHYNGKTSIVKGSRNQNYSRGIDISNEVAVAFIRSLIEEYGQLFRELGSTKFDIGGDELLGWGSAIVSNVNKWQQLDHWKTYAQNRAKAEGVSNWTDAVAYDGFMYYMNDLYELVTDLGYTSVRMWNDDALRSADTGWQQVIKLNKNIDIWFWTTGKNSVWAYANEDYQVYNILSDYNYYAMTSDYFSDNRGSFTQAYADEIYNEWTPYTFDPSSTTLGEGKNMAIGNPNVLGSAFGIWSDNPTLRTEDEVMSDVLPLIRAHGAKAWDAKENTQISYSVFSSHLNKLGDAPQGTVNAADIYIVADLSVLRAAVSEYASYYADDYTAESFAVYTAAVAAGEEVLNSLKPLQSDVDAAVKAIQNAKASLTVKSKADLSVLLAALEEYYNTDASDYTSESFAAYEQAVKMAQELIDSENYDQVAINTAAASIKYAKEALVEYVLSDQNWFVQGAFKTSKVYVGKVATLSVSSRKDVVIDHYEIYSDLGGASKELVRCTVNTRNTARDITTMIFQAEEHERGDRTYSVYAVFKDGTRSKNCETFNITVK